MRIFYAVGDRPHAALTSSRVWHSNLYLPLLDLGHEVVTFHYDLHGLFDHLDPSNPASARFISQQRPLLERSLLSQVARAHEEAPVDLFFSYFYSAFASPETIARIRAMGIYTVNWYCNAAHQFHLVSELAPAYDACLVPERFRLADYERIGAHAVYCQEAANPTIYHPHVRTHEFDVSFVGACYGERVDFIRYLLGRGVDIHVWGPGWDRVTKPSPSRRARRGVGRGKRWLLRQPQHARWLPREPFGAPLSDHEMVRMFSRSEISLGFSVVGETHSTSQPVRQVRLRDFEGPMSGAFYMVERMAEIEEFFTPGLEIVCYSDKEELADQILYYLAHEDEREAIRVAGHRRALRDHTWQNRLSTVFTALGLPK